MVFEFPKSLKEVSGIQKAKSSDLIWTIEDSGNENELYSLNLKGEIESAIKIEDLQNNDWEDLTSDKEGNLYIDDFGNNDSIRKDIAIYKIDLSDSTNSVAKISFYYPEQTDFPPKKKSFFMTANHFLNTMTIFIYLQKIEVWKSFFWCR